MAKVTLSDDVKKRLQERGYNYQSNESKPTTTAAQDRYFAYQEKQLEREGGRRYAETTLKPKELVTLTSRSGKTVSFNARGDSRVGNALDQIAKLHSSYQTIGKMSRGNTNSWRSSMQKWASQAAMLRTQLQRNTKLSAQERETLIEYIDDMGKDITSGYRQVQDATEQRRISKMSSEELQRYRENNIALWQRLAGQYSPQANVGHGDDNRPRTDTNPYANFSGTPRNLPADVGRKWVEDTQESQARSQADLRIADMYSKKATEEANYAYRELNDRRIEEVSRIVNTDPEAFTNTAEAARRLSAYYANPNGAERYTTRERDFAEVNKALVANGMERIQETDDDETKRRKVLELDQFFNDKAASIGLDYESILTTSQEIADADESARTREEFNEMLKRNPGVLPLMNAIAIPTSLTSGPELVANVIRGAIHGRETDLSTYRPLTGADFTETAFVADVQKQTSEAITQAIEEKGGSEFMQQFGQFGYNVAFSIAQSMLAAGVSAAAPAALADTQMMFNLLGETGLALMATSAGSQTMLETLEKGGSVRQACVLGVTSAIFEAVAEKIPLDNLAEMLSGNLANANFVIQMLKQSGFEGAEEVITEIANTVTDVAVMGYSSDFYQNLDEYMATYIAEGMSKSEAEAKAKKQALLDLASQVGMAGLSGATSGLFTGGFGMVTGRIGNNQRISTDANTVYDVALQTRDVQHVGSIIADGYKANDRRAKAIIEEISKKTGKSVAELTQTDERGNYTGTMTADDFESVSKRDFKGIYSRMVHGYERAQRIVARDEEREDRRLEREVRRGTEQEYDDSFEVKRIDSIDEDGTVTYTNNRGEQVTADGIDNIPAGRGANEIVAYFEDTGANTVVNNNTMLQAFDSYIQTEDTPVSAEDFAYDWRDVQERMLRGMSAHDALSPYSDQETLHKFLELATSKEVLPEANIQETTQLALPAQTETAINNAREERATRRKPYRGYVSLGIDPDGASLIEQANKARGNDTEAMRPAPKAEDLTPDQKLAVGAAQVVSMRGGMRVVCFTGEENSHYDPNLETMFINLDNGLDNNDGPLKAVAHESVHFLADYSPSGFGNLRDYVRDKMGALAFEAAVNDVAAQYDLDLNDKTGYLVACQEVVAQMLEDVFQSQNGLAEIREVYRRKQGILKTFIGHIADTFKGIADRIKGMRRTSASIAKSAKQFNDLYDMFRSELTEAGTRYKMGGQSSAVEQGISHFNRKAKTGTVQTQTNPLASKTAREVRDANDVDRVEEERKKSEKRLAVQSDNFKARLATAKANATLTTLVDGDPSKGHMMTQAGADRVVSALLDGDALKGYTEAEQQLFKQIPKYSLSNALLQTFNSQVNDSRETRTTRAYTRGTIEELYANLAERFTRANFDRTGMALVDDEVLQSIIRNTTVAIYSEVFNEDNKAFRLSKMDRARETALYYKAKLQAQREERVKRNIRKSIAQRLMKWTDNAVRRKEGANAIPDTFVNAIVSMAELIDPTSVNWKTGGLSESRAVAAKWASLKEELRQMYTPSERTYKFDKANDPFSTTLDAAMSVIEETITYNRDDVNIAVADMNVDQLKTLNEQMKMITRLVTNYDRGFTRLSQAHRYSIQSATTAAWRRLDKVKKNNIVSRLLLSQGYTNPRLVRLMEGYNPNGYLTRVIDEGRNLRYRMQHKQMQILKPFYDMIFGDNSRDAIWNVKQRQETVSNEADYMRKCEVLRDFGDIYDVDTGERVQLTEMEAMYMYMEWQRENAQGTLMHSAHDNGFQLPNHDDIRDNQPKSIAYKDGHHVMMNDDLIRGIYDRLDEWDKEFMRRAGETFNGECSDLINMGAAPVLGYTVATEKAYIPAKAYLPNSRMSEDGGVTGRGYLIQSGLLKAPSGRSSAPIMVQNLNTVLFDHVEASTEIGYMLRWELDAKRIGTAKVQGDMTLDDELRKKWSTKQIQIGQAYGRAINELVYGSATQDTGEQAGLWDAMITGLSSMYSKFVFNANPLAALKQLSGGPLAMSFIGGTQTVSALPRAIRLMADPNAMRRLIDQINQHTALVYNRTFDKNYGKMGRIAEWLMDKAIDDENGHKTFGAIKALAKAAEKGGVTFVRTAEKITMHDVMSFMDIAAIVSLWQPTINHVKLTWNEDINGKAQMSNKAFAEEVTKLFEKMISETQPMDDQIYRQQLFKGGKGKYTRLVYMFMSPAFQQFGLIREARGELSWAIKNGDKEQKATALKRVAYAYTGLAYSTMLNATIMAAFAAARGKFKKYRDEKTGEINWWTVLRQVGVDAASEFGESLLPFTKGYITDALVDTIFSKKNIVDAIASIPQNLIDDTALTYVENIGALIESLRQAGNALFEADDDESLKERQDRIDELMGALGEAGKNLLSSLGIPFTNAMKMVDIGRHIYSTFATGDFLDYDDYTLNADQVREQLLKAVESGDLQAARDLADDIFQTELDKYQAKYWLDYEENPNSDVKYVDDARKTTYSKLTEYVKKMWTEGKIDNEQAVKLLDQFADISQVRGHVSVDVADMYGVNNYYKVQSWQHSKDTKGRDIDEGSRWADIYDDYVRGVSTGADEKKLLDLYEASFRANGSSTLAAEEKFNSDKKSGIKKLAIEDLNAGRITFDKMSKILEDIGCSGTQIMTAYTESLQQGVEEPLATASYAASLIVSGRDSAYEDFTAKWSEAVGKDVTASVRGALENMLVNNTISTTQFETVAKAHELYDSEVKLFKAEQKALDAEEDTVYEQAAEALRIGNTGTFESLENAYVNAAVADGDFEEEARKTFDQAVILQVKDEYLKGEVSDAEFASLYTRYSWRDDYEIPLMLHAFADRKAHPEDTSTVSTYSPLKRMINEGDRTAISNEIYWLMNDGTRYASSIATSLKSCAEQVGKLRRSGRGQEADALKSSIQYAFNIIGKKIDWSKYDY